MKSAVDYLVEQLQAPCRGIPSHIIEEAKRLEKEQILDARDNGIKSTLKGYSISNQEYYNQTYNQNK